MNKKGFTLIELIVITVILGVIILFTLPNITSSIEKQKKTQMIIDAKDMIEKTKKILVANKAFYPSSNNEKKVFSLNFIDPKNEIEESPYGGYYNKNLSFVVVTNNSGNYEYQVSLLACDAKREKVEFNSYTPSNNIVIGNEDYNEDYIKNDRNLDGYLNALDNILTPSTLYNYSCRQDADYYRLDLSTLTELNDDNRFERIKEEYGLDTSNNYNYINNTIEGSSINGFYY